MSGAPLNALTFNPSKAHATNLGAYSDLNPLVERRAEASCMLQANAALRTVLLPNTI